MASIKIQAPAGGQAPVPAVDRRQIADRLNGEMARHSSLEARTEAIAAAVPGRVAFSTSLGMEDQAILHAIATAGAPFDVFTLDTGRLFPETLETIFETEARYGLKIRVLAPDAAEVEELVANDGVYGFRYSVEARKACCEVRKVRPLNRALAGAAAWLTGIRREQSIGRQHIAFAAYDDAQALIKINPIADWPLDALKDYVAVNNVPINPLHERGFVSIGCQPCTRAIKLGEDFRAGRWWWEQENAKECGLHTQNDRAERASTLKGRAA